MAVNDTVCVLDPADNLSNGFLGSQAALFGSVNAEPGGALSDVLWYTGKLVQNVPQARLAKVFAGSDAALAIVGKYIQMTAYGFAADFGLDDPKNPAFSGIVVGAFRTAAYDAQAPASDDGFVVLTKSGRLFVFESNENNTFRVDEGRRVV